MGVRYGYGSRGGILHDLNFKIRGMHLGTDTGLGIFLKKIQISKVELQHKPFNMVYCLEGKECTIF